MSVHLFATGTFRGKEDKELSDPMMDTTGATKVKGQNYLHSRFGLVISHCFSVPKRSMV